MSLRIHLRRLLRSRVFLITAVLAMSLGLGANIILFNAAYALLWRPLGFDRPEHLVTLQGRSTAGNLQQQLTGRDASILRQQSTVVAETGLTRNGRLVALLSGDEALEMTSAVVNSGYFRALGLRPLAGRFFGEEEDLGRNPEQRAVLTESTWRNHFASDPSVAGRILLLRDGAVARPVRIIGVVPGAATLPFASDAGVLLPIAWLSEGVRTNFGDALYRSVLRLAPGVPVASASAQIDAALQLDDMGSAYGKWGRHWLEPLRSALAPANRQTILLLYGAACLLLLLTCANLASLFLARSIAHAPETSVHMALGASHGRLLRANFQEAALVCAAGIVLAFAAESWTRPLVPRFLPLLRRLGPELLAPGPMLLAFGVVIWLGVSALISIASAWHLRRLDIAASLSHAGRSGVDGAGRFRAFLAASQLAIVLTLLTVAGLVGRSFLAAARSDPGLDPQGVLTFQVSLPGVERYLSAVADLRSQIASIPGVKAVTFGAEAPVGSTSMSAATGAHPGKLISSDPMIAYRLIGPAYFETLSARFASGRAFSDEEIWQQQAVVILNQSAARLLFPGEDAIGRTLQPAFRPGRSAVVGVVKDVRTAGLDQAPVPMIYMPYLPVGSLRWTVRTDRATEVFIPLLKSRVSAWNGQVVLQRFRPLQDMLDETVRDRALAGKLVGVFALLGLMISSVGLYGTLASQVQQRRREIGIRIALGATVRTVMRIVLAEGTRVAALGTVGGLAGSVAAARVIRPQLYGIGPLDWISFAIALAILSGAAFAACLIPAFMAARVDPMRTLNTQ
jgi:putative ABC transport system permease protein